MRRILTAVMDILGLTGSAKATRYIGKLEKTALQLDAAVDQINSEIAEQDARFAQEMAAFREREADHHFVQGQRIVNKARAARVAIRLSSLVS